MFLSLVKASLLCGARKSTLMVVNEIMHHFCPSAVLRRERSAAVTQPAQDCGGCIHGWARHYVDAASAGCHTQLLPQLGRVLCVKSPNMQLFHALFMSCCCHCCLFAAHLLNVRVNGQPLSRNQLKTEVAAFMAAGFETTSHAITWTLAALAVHPDIQQQLVDELSSLGLAAAAGEPVRVTCACSLRFVTL
jgi:hypothetical protein